MASRKGVETFSVSVADLIEARASPGRQAGEQTLQEIAAEKQMAYWKVKLLMQALVKEGVAERRACGHQIYYRTKEGKR